MQMGTEREPVASTPAETHPTFEQIYESAFDMVCRALIRYGVAKTQLEDALQEVFAIVHHRLEDFEGRSSLRTWIYGIARRVARDYRPESRLEPVDPHDLESLANRSGGTDGNLEHLDAAMLLFSLLDQLEPERREIVILVELEQMTVAEAAEVLEVNPNTLQSRLKQAREDLSRACQRKTAEQAWRRQCATKTQR